MFTTIDVMNLHEMQLNNYKKTIIYLFLIPRKRPTGAKRRATGATYILVF